MDRVGHEPARGAAPRPGWGWAWRMAWRDSRRSRKRLALYVSSMTLGVAALVAIGSFRENMRTAVATQARSLIGADLRVSSRERFSEQAEALFTETFGAELGAERSRLISFSSMARFPGGAHTPAEQRDAVRLVRVRALEGEYPYYGTLQTEPAAAAHTFREGAAALVDAAVMLQFDARVGDEIVVGRRSYSIAGTLLSVPGESAASAMFGPRVYLPLPELDPELLVRGSRAEYQALFRFPPGTDVDSLRDEHRPFFRENRMRANTAASTEEGWAEGLDNLYGFLSLVGFVALLLGGLGVGSSMHVYVRSKLDTVAVLRCLGTSSWRALSVYLIQATLIGGLGALAGAALGVAVQQVLPRILADLLPMDVAVSIQPAALGRGIAIGWAAAVLFALAPLLTVRRVPPLRALRSTHEPRRDPLRWPLFALIALSVAGFAYWETGELLVGLGFAGGVGVAFGLLALVARLVSWVVQHAAPRRGPYTWRQGLANLHRPHNQTVLLMVSLGLGTFLILTLHLVQYTLVEQLALSGGGNAPNVVLFDIQSDQRDDVVRLVEDQGLDVRQVVPIVTMRLSSVKGRPVTELRNDESRETPNWVLRREYRSTYRAGLVDTERLLEGRLVAEPWVADGPAPVSIEQDIAEDLGVGLGDALVFDVQGIPVETVIGSIREVDWRRVQPNFFVVFPPGVLDAAPQFHVLVTRADGPGAMAGLQRAIVSAFPNVSLIDITLILEVADNILGHVSFVIRFMALFSILAGTFVLMSSVVVSRSQRTEESVLLRTLGATRAQVTRIMNVEYLLLGLLATLTGMLLALSAGWALSNLVFEQPFTPSWRALAVTPVVVCGLTWIVGRLHSRGVHQRPPLAVLRGES